MLEDIGEIDWMALKSSIIKIRAKFFTKPFRNYLIRLQNMTISKAQQLFTSQGPRVLDFNVKGQVIVGFIANVCTDN